MGMAQKKRQEDKFDESWDDEEIDLHVPLPRKREGKRTPKFRDGFTGYAPKREKPRRAARRDYDDA